ncbi:MAG: hypothetical protein DCC67_03215 [Planctomycetota bacterium]|nr:MAG: hypothetical protein DCC67_03215 [Planctomycetota bacterium]
MSHDGPDVDDYALESYRPYLRLLASQQLAWRYRAKVDPSGIVQETLWEAHRQLAQGRCVPDAERPAWLRRILANNLTDAVRRFMAARRDVGREVSLHRSIDRSSQRLERWLVRDLGPGHAFDGQDRLAALAAALERLPAAQRDALVMHYCSGVKLSDIARELGRSRDAVAGLIKRGLRQLRDELGAAPCPRAAGGIDVPAESR